MQNIKLIKYYCLIIFRDIEKLTTNLVYLYIYINIIHMSGLAFATNLVL